MKIGIWVILFAMTTPVFAADPSLKFKCINKTVVDSKSKSTDILLTAKPEFNTSFRRWTAESRIILLSVSEDSAHRFIDGQEYLVTFTKVEKQNPDRDRDLKTLKAAIKLIEKDRIFLNRQEAITTLQSLEELSQRLQSTIEDK